MRQEQIPYTPTRKERESIKPKEGMLKVSGDGVFATLQGEGVTAGKSAVFLRLHYCNLACGKESGWKCDTGYTWDKDRPEYWQEPEDWSYDTAVQRIWTVWREKFGDNPDKTLVITGGEPLLQQGKIIELIDRLPTWDIEIETNGTIVPVDKLSGCQFNCSPKLANSGNSLLRRYNPSALVKINSFPNSWFKFVACNISDLDEIEAISTECRLDQRKILVMPEGQTLEKVEAHAAVLESAVKEKGWQLVMRNHLKWFGTKRRT